MQVVGKYTDSFSAEVAKGMLEAEGIAAFVLNQNVGIITGVINNDLISIDLVVEDENYEEASKLLAAASSAS